MPENKIFRHPPFKIAMDGFAFTLPQDWEIVSYSLDAPLESGRFGFASEDGDQGQFSWRTVKAIPDIQRIIEEVHRRYLIADAAPKMTFTKHSANGIVSMGYAKQGERFYASAFNLKKMYLCEWIFPKYNKNTAAEVIPMLESFTFNPPDEQKRQFYALFGLECSIPAEYHFEKMEAYPAAITLFFENRSHYMLNVHRYGLADIYMQGGTLENFYHRCLFAHGCNIRDVKAAMPVFDHAVAEIEYRARGKFGFDYLLGPWWKGFGSAILLSGENRIYAYEHLASRFEEKREKLRDIFAPKLKNGHGSSL